MTKLPKGTLMTNEQYTQLLKEVYPSIDIVPVERYISPQATIRHRCKSCYMNFFDKPSNLVNKADTVLGHVCNESVFNRIGNTGYTTHNKYSFQHNEDTEKLVNALLLVEVGYSIQEVAEYLKISPAFLKKSVSHFGIVSKNKLKRNSVVVTGEQNENNTMTKKRQEIREMLQVAREVSRLLEIKAKKEAENNTDNN